MLGMYFNVTDFIKSYLGYKSTKEILSKIEIDKMNESRQAT